MLALVVTMLVILAVAAGTLALVMVGMEGRGWRQVPQLARLMRRVARHLNGEGRPPRKLQALDRR
ncbi:MAG TPA: hypothetical protein VE617_03405 [Propionibacteriaceae bacterium]|jgi:hypothetical protein|nr:hypothetical protein [Propionibacteriaceae bacterium]